MSSTSFKPSGLDVKPNDSKPHKGVKGALKGRMKRPCPLPDVQLMKATEETLLDSFRKRQGELKELFNNSNALPLDFHKNIEAKGIFAVIGKKHDRVDILKLVSGLDAGLPSSRYGFDQTGTKRKLYINALEKNIHAIECDV